MINQFKDIFDSEKIKNVQLINKGWSKDKKYRIEINSDKYFLLKISNITEYNTKKRDFELLKQIDEQSFLMSRPIEFGLFNQGKEVYTLFNWIEGEDAENIIPLLSDIEQYNIGICAGEILRKIHQVKIPIKQTPWSEYFNKKIDRNVKVYEACSIKFEGSDSIIEYINTNRRLLENRIQVLQHGDYHIGNMILTKNNDLGIIDFNRLDFGDPWEEFNRITFCSGVSKFFASGRINGYFDNDVPDMFFRLLALYIGSNQLSSIPWAIPFGEKDTKIMLQKAVEVLESFNGFETYIPNWYISKDKI
jgi:aminoglycoside phosphotransferase (APT) family kinase protein